jgi:hypothetical protein
MSRTECSIDGCSGHTIARGWCRRHYNKWWHQGDPLAPDRHQKAMLFFDQAIKTETEDCIFWIFSTSGGPRAREMCAKAHGPRPSKRHGVAHSCGNGHLGCINRKHLRWATQKENLADRIGHGTANRGERHGNARLSREKVKQIRARLARVEFQSDIAKSLGIGQTTVSHIHRGSSWGWLE